jgi:hypothetical protein
MDILSIGKLNNERSKRSGLDKQRLTPKADSVFEQRWVTGRIFSR